MSRSGYTDDCDYDWWSHIRWRGQVASSIRGKRGQEFLRALLKALDDLPEKRLIANELEADGNVCTIGALGRARGLDMAKLDPEDSAAVSGAFNIAEPLAREIVFLNDECGWNETPEQRWARMRRDIASMIKEQSATIQAPDKTVWISFREKDTTK